MTCARCIGELEYIYQLIPSKKQKIEETIKSVDMPCASKEWMRSYGPRAACAQIDFDTMRKRDKAIWIEQARVASVLGASSRALSSLRSGLRCYLVFAG